MQAEVRYLSPYRREGGTLENVAGERPNATITTAPQRIFAQTNPITHLGADEGSCSFNGGPGGIMQLPTGDNDNRGQQIFQLVMQPPLPPNLGKKSQAFNVQAQYTSNVVETEEFIVKEKFITFPQDHQPPRKYELRGKVYCKYHNSWNQVLILAGVLGMLSKTGLTRKSR